MTTNYNFSIKSAIYDFSNPKPSWEILKWYKQNSFHTPLNKSQHSFFEQSSTKSTFLTQRIFSVEPKNCQHEISQNVVKLRNFSGRTRKLSIYNVSKHWWNQATMSLWNFTNCGDTEKFYRTTQNNVSLKFLETSVNIGIWSLLTQRIFSVEQKNCQHEISQNVVKLRIFLEEPGNCQYTISRNINEIKRQCRYEISRTAVTPRNFVEPCRIMSSLKFLETSVSVNIGIWRKSPKCASTPFELRNSCQYFSIFDRKLAFWSTNRA